jgi:hypothetical protein
MKHIAFLLLFLPLSLPAGEQQVARYQIVSAVRLVHSTNGTRSEPVVLKLDTTTGQSWALMTSQFHMNAGGPLLTSVGWITVEQDYVQATVFLQSLAGSLAPVPPAPPAAPGVRLLRP